MVVMVVIITVILMTIDHLFIMCTNFESAVGISGARWTVNMAIMDVDEVSILMRKMVLLLHMMQVIIVIATVTVTEIVIVIV